MVATSVNYSQSMVSMHGYTWYYILIWLWNSELDIHPFLLRMGWENGVQLQFQTGDNQVITQKSVWEGRKIAVFETLVYRYRCFPRSGFAAVFMDVGWRSININHLSFKWIFWDFCTDLSAKPPGTCTNQARLWRPKGGATIQPTFNIFVQFPKGNQRQQLQIDGPPCMHIYIYYKHA